MSTNNLPPHLPRLVLPLLTALLCSTAAALQPIALVLEYQDQWTKTTGAAELLTKAGFDVAPLPLDRSPADLTADVIFIGSFASEHPAYAAYMKQYHEALDNYVDKGHLFVQMTQADQVERVPPFLPATHPASRCDSDFAQALLLSPNHPLAAGLTQKIQFHPQRTVWESLDYQRGFEVILAGDPDAQFPALVEGAYGPGRILLSAMPFDKKTLPGGDPDADALHAFQEIFFANLAKHALDIRQRKIQPVKVTPPPLAAQPFLPGSWTLAVLPDTQVYAQTYPGLYLAQTAWLRLNYQRLNIKYALQLGDITNTSAPREWANARDAWSLLDDCLPYALCPGNHDFGGGGATTRTSLLSEYFPPDQYQDWPTFGGVFEPGKLDNSYHLFEAGGRKWIIIALEWAPRDETVAWANQIMVQHPDHYGILITHAYLNNNDLRYDHNDTEHSQLYSPYEYHTPGTMNDGQELWDKLVRKYNFALVLNGHVLGDGAGYLASKNDQGHIVHQMLANYQFRTLGGEGYLRLLEFRPDGKTVQVKTYSPLYDNYLIEPDQQFTFQLDH